jgi:tetratricopeptide (TPR) repeat protein
MAGIAVVEVGMFTPAEGAAFLSRATGLNPAGDGMRLGAMLGWLPLGLAQAAAFIVRTRMSYNEYAGLLQGQDLDETLRQQAGADHPGVLKATRLSLTGLAEADSSGDAGRLLRVLSLLSPDGVSRDLLARGEQQLGLTGGVWPAVKVLTEASLAIVGGDVSASVPSDDRRVVVVHRLTARVVRHEAARPPGDDLSIAVDSVARWLDTLTDGFPLAQVALRRDELDELAAHLDAITGNTGDPSPLLLTQADWIGRLLQAGGDLTRAVALQRRTLAESERVLGPDHPDTLTSRNNLAAAYESAGRLDEAIALLERTLAESERVLGPDHPNTLSSRNNLASAYASAGRLNEAITLHERTLTESERVLGPDHPNTLTYRNNLASTRLRVGP